MSDTAIIEQFTNAVAAEVERATRLHGSMNSLHEAYAVIAEEFDEFWELVKVNPKKLSEDARARRIQEMRIELIQIAAMSVRTIIDCGL